MKKFIKILGILVLTVIIAAYAAFLFVLPKVIDLNPYVAQVQDIVIEQTNLKLNLENPRISVSPLLQAGIQADNINVKLTDDSDIMTADKLTARISLPALLFMTVKLSEAEIINPQINVDIADGKAFKAVQAYEVILAKKEAALGQTKQEVQEENPLEKYIDISKIKYVVPNLKLINYQACVNDLQTGEYLKLHGDKLLFGYNNGDSVSLKTNAQFSLNEESKINADVDIDTIIPKASKLDDEDDKPERVEIPFVNPITVYKEYDLKANIVSKIKVRRNDNQIVSRGFFNIDNFSIKLSDIQLPESMFHLKTSGTKAVVDTNLFITDEEKLSLLGMVNYSKRPSLDLKFTSDKIHLSNVLTLIKATLDSLHIRNELNLIEVSGEFFADTSVKTNFKKLKSQGSIDINNCLVRNIQAGKDLFKLNSIISFDDNILNIKDTIGEIAETIIKINGAINEKSYTDISVIIEKLPLKKVFLLFLPSDINKKYQINSGDIYLNASINGELKKALASFTIDVIDTSVTDRDSKIDYSDKHLSADFKSDFKTITGKITNNDFKLVLNGASISCGKIDLNIDENNIYLSPSKISVNNATNIEFNGRITDYTKNPVINFDAQGFVRTQDIKQFIGEDISYYLADKGMLPVELSLNGNGSKQTLNFSVDANKNNYVTPVHIKNVFDKNTTLRATIDFKGDRIKIKDTGFFIKDYTQDENGELVINYDEILGIDGTITQLNTPNPNINLIKIRFPQSIKGNINLFPESEFSADGQMFVFGALDNPRIRGGFNIFDISVPELFITIEKIVSQFEGKDINIDIKNVLANGSDYNILASTDINPSEYFTIKSLNIISNLTDVDTLMDVSNSLMNYLPKSNSAETSDIPVIVKNGKANISQIKTGNIVLSDTACNLELSNNKLYVNRIMTSGFKGKISGNVVIDLITNEIKAVLNGNKLDVEQMLLDAAAMKDTLTGTMDFDTDISIKGNTLEEQMKNLKGSIDFTMTDGQLGPFGRIENLIMAENIRESQFFQSTIGTILNSMLSFNTTKYNTLTGHLDFADGIAKIIPITTSGDIMATYIFGDFDLLKNTIDIKMRGCLGSQVSESMGPLALLNPVNLVKATPGMSLILGKIFFLFTEQVTSAEMEQIPSLGKDISDNNSTKFQVVLRGDTAKPFSLVKSFKWLALESDIQAAQNYVQKNEEEEAVRQAEEAAKAEEEAKPQIIQTKDKAINKYKEVVNKIKSKFSKETEIETDANDELLQE